MSDDPPPASNQHQRPPPLFVLVLSTALGSLGLHMVLPALPEMAAVFAIPEADIGFVVTAYLVGLAAAQLVIGPLSDRFGRRPVLISGIVLFLAMTALCMATPSAAWLFAGRTLQAFGGCAGTVLGRAVIRDTYPRSVAASSMGYLSVAVATGSMISPAIGAFVDAGTGWRGIFVVLGLLGAIALAATARFLPETNRMRLDRLDLYILLRNYRWLCGSRVFLLYAGTIAVQLSGWFAFVTVMPGALVTVYHEPATVYGLWVFLPMSGYILGNAVVGRLSVRVGSAALIKIGATVSAVGALALIAGALGFIPGPAAYFATMAVIVFGNGLVTPNANVAAISVNPSITGAASGLLGFLQGATSAVATAIVSAAGSANVTALAAVIVIGNVLGILFLISAPR